MFKKNVSKFLVLFLIIMFIRPIFAFAEESSDYVVFKDTNLECDIRYLLNKPSGPITKDDMKMLTKYQSSDKPINDLTGLEHATNLKQLKLLHTGGPSKLSDLSPIKGLINLEDLWINSGSISDITPVANLINLKTLILSDNNISNIKPVSGLSNLEYLDLGNPLSKSPTTANLGLFCNKITDISAVADLRYLTGLNLHSNEIYDITPISGLTNLNKLWLGYNKIKDITPLKNITTLKMLNLVGNQINDITALKDSLSNMTDLNLGENNISNIDSLINTSSLTSLALHMNPITSIEAVKNNLNLQYLQIYSTNVSNLSPLTNCKNLYYLDIAHYTKSSNDISRGGIKDITPLKNAANLSYLNASRNNIEDISVISNLKNLSMVNLDDNWIKDITPIYTNFNSGGLKNCNFSINLNNIDVSKGSNQLNMLENLSSNGLRIFYGNQFGKNIQVVSVIGSNRYDTAVKLSQSQFVTSDTIIIVNGGAMADGLGATPLAAFKKAPLLLTETKSLPTSTINEIKRLKAKNAIIVGGTGVVSDNVESQLESLGLTVDRISGSNRYATSLKIAEYLDQNCYDVSRIVVSNGYGEADALSIASAAGRDNMPIILVEKDKIPSEVYDWLASENLDNAYIIGGTGVVTDNVLNKIDGITAVNVRNNRLGGQNRYETNALVIDKFYGSIIDKTYIAKGYVLIDALAAGPAAAINGAPVVLADKDLSLSQKSVLDKRYGDAVIRAGGGISDTAVNSLKNCIQ